MKLTKFIFLITAFFMLQGASVYAQTDRSDISGSWLGTLQVGAVELRLVFNLTLEESGEYSATMDSPDQGASGIPAGEITFINDSLRIEVPSTMGFYSGVLMDNGEIIGEWSQMGQVLKLDLKRQEQSFELNRPQEPVPPFPYEEVEVLFQNIKADISLAGTITHPVGKGKYPAVVLVSGSGPQNRDEELMGHKPFSVLADYLTRNGIIVLRYDDRGVAGSGGTMIGSTSEDFMEDARSAIEYLKTLDYVDGKKIGVIGHSEGGLITFMLAAEYNDISFIVSMAGPGYNGRITLEDQTEYISRISGVPESTIESNKEPQSMINQLIEKISDPEEGVRIVRDSVSAYYSAMGYGQEIIDQILTNMSTLVNVPGYNWLRYFYMLDPQELFPSISCHVLAINGSRDCQVLAAKNIKAIAEGLKKSGNNNVNTKIFADLNHLFQHCETGLPAEYGQIEETINPEVLDYIGSWINGLF
jgi:pimeloyl-ACP methyl ester carboxylesterase